MTARTLKHVDDVAPDTTANVTTVSVNGSYVVVYSVQVTGLAAEDIVYVVGQYEVTNDLGFVVGVGRVLLRAASASATTGTAIMPAVMDNVTPDMHHKADQIVAMDTGMSGTVYYNLVLNAVSSYGNGNLTVEQGYGKLQAMVLKR